MKKLSFILLLSVLGISIPFSAQTTDEKYIAQFAKIAVEEMQLYRIPASITLAQGLLETADGQSELAQNANNHFGIKCKKEWQGETYRYTDDAYMECFRKYDSPRDSYRDHSKFLAERPYYKALFKLDIYDYKAWSHGLKKAGYATNPRYAPLLISKIEKYNLDQFDRVSPDMVDAKLLELYPNLANIMVEEEVIEMVPKEPIEIIEDKVIVASNENEQLKDAEEKILKAPAHRQHPLERIQRHPNRNLKYIHVQKGETLSSLAKQYKLSTDDLATFNDLDNPNLIKIDQMLFIQKKKNKGNTKTYIVQVGDDLHSISQDQGIRLSSLLKRNRLEKGDTISVGQVIYLKGKKKK